MDFYFTDRKFNTLGVASTGPAPIQIDADTDDQMRPQAVGRTYAATLVTDPKDADKLATMAALGNFLLYEDPRGQYVFATIMEWTEYDPQAGELSFSAENGGVDLINETVGAYTADKAYSIADYIKRFTADSGYEIGINELAGQTRTLKWEGDEDTALKRIESVATQFDNAELDFRFEVDGMQVLHRYIDIYKHMGVDNGQRLEVNTQLNKITTTGNIYDLCTSIKGTGAAASGSDTPINLVGYHWTDPDGRYVLGGDGVLRDTVAVQLWSRALSNDNPNPTAHHIQRVKSYEATTQATLLQSVLADLKQYNHAAINYTVDIADLPDGVSVGDTVHLVDEAQGLNLSARLLELKDSYAADTHEATLGDYLIEASQIDPALQELAEALAKQNKGKDGADAVVLSVSSVNGNMFKNTGISTILTVSISVGGSILDTAEKMHAVFGTEAYLQWQVKNVGELEFTNVPLTDTRLSDEGFLFAVGVADVDNKSTFKCDLYY